MQLEYDPMQGGPAPVLRPRLHRRRTVPELPPVSAVGADAAPPDGASSVLEGQRATQTDKHSMTWDWKSIMKWLPHFWLSLVRLVLVSLI